MRSLLTLWIATLLVHFSLAQGHKPNLAPQEKQQAALTQGIAENSSPVLPGNAQATSPPSPQGAQCGGAKGDEKTPDGRIILFTGVLALVGVLQFGAMVFQYSAMRKQADYMRRGLLISIRTTRIARRSAAAAQASAKTASESLEMLVGKERARIRVEVEPFDLDSASVLGTKQVKFKVFSYGQTAAFIYGSGEWVEIDESEEYERGNHVFAPISIPAVLHPSVDGYESTALLFTDLTDLHVDRIYRKKLFVHFQGYIKYRDVFEREHETRFRYKWVPGAPTGSMAVSVRYWTEVGGKESNCQT